MMIKKRFIAGAVCTQCKAMDTIAMFTSPNDEWIACVSCGYSERRPTAAEINQQAMQQPTDDGSIQGVIKIYPSSHP